MDENDNQLLILMTNEDKLRLARYTSSQIMELGYKFRDARQKLSEIDGVPDSLITQMDDVIKSIDEACTQSSEAELKFLQTSSKNTPLN